jgi:hypothetical protein
VIQTNLAVVRTRDRDAALERSAARSGVFDVLASLSDWVGKIGCDLDRISSTANERQQ